MFTILAQYRLPQSSILGLLPLALLCTAACQQVVVSGTGEGGRGEPRGTSSSSSVASSSSSVASSSSSVASSSSSSSGSWISTTSSGGGGGNGCADPANEALPPGACVPTSPACGATTSLCLATADADAAPVFGLRVAHLGLTAPAALVEGSGGSIFQSSTLENLTQCGLEGEGLFNWLLRFDTTLGTLTTGAAAPVADPTAGYAFVDATLTLGGVSFAVAPLTLFAPLDATCGVESSAGDVLMPFYGGAGGSLMTVLPLRSLRFFSTEVTPDHNCIGAFNAAGLSAAGCRPDATHPQFLDGGQLEAFISLEDADTVLVPVLDETLCAFLTNGPQRATSLGDVVAQGCARGLDDAILAQGDWCSTTNAPAMDGCADAVRFAGSFAASGTTIR